MPESGSFGPSGNPTTAAAAGASCLRGVVKLLALVVVPWCLILKAELYPKLARVQLDWVTPCAAHLQVSWEKMRKDGHLPVDARCPVRGTPYRIRQSRQGVTLYCPAYHDLFECVWTGWPTHYFGFTHTPPWYPLGRGTYELFVGPKGKVHRVRVRRSTLLPDDTGHLGSTIRFPDAKGASRTTGLLRVEATWTVPEQG